MFVAILFPFMCVNSDYRPPLFVTASSSEKTTAQKCSATVARLAKRLSHKHQIISALGSSGEP